LIAISLASSLSAATFCLASLLAMNVWMSGGSVPRWIAGGWVMTP